jgi:hypothetical protein
MAGRGIKRARGKGPAGLLQLQIEAAKLGMGWLAMSTGAASVIAHRTLMMGRAMAEPVRLADPEFALMITEKLAAAGEAAERASRRAVRRRRRASDPVAAATAAVDAAQTCLMPFSRRVRANVKRLGRKHG